MQRSLNLHPLDDGPERFGVGPAERVSQDQTEVDIAHECAEAAVGQAAQGVGGHQSFVQYLPVGGHRLGEDGLALLEIFPRSRIVVYARSQSPGPETLPRPSSRISVPRLVVTAPSL